MRRSVRAEMRLAVIAATAPLAKRMTGIGDVLIRAGHRRADRIDMGDLARHQRQHQVQIVDHQVENDGYVCAARLERGDPGGLDIQRRADPAGEGAMRGGKALQVADLQHQPALLGQAGQLVGLLQGGGDRLFHQHMLAGAQRGGGEGVMGLGRRRDHQRVAGGEQRRKVHVGGAGLPADRAGALVIDVVDAGQDGALRRRRPSDAW